ncbi:copper resistance CopC family protein [Nonomuraea sp. NPDC003804]|uniref:copper resistance CopC family protein n=1 Tax=Nonomuraea sp. NPDC003804 TaxID=3154547 RepID=UPI0033AF8DAD
MKRSPLPALTALLAVLVGAVLTAPPALAHDALKSSTPKKNATVATLEQVELEFTSTPKLPFVIVRADDGAEMQAGKPEIDGKVVRQRLKGVLPDGGYTIAFRVVSSDGHPIEGEIPFAVKGAPRPEPTGQPASAVPQSASPGQSAPATAPAAQSAPATAAQSAPAVTPAAQSAAPQPVAGQTSQAATGFPVWLVIVIGGLVGIGIGFLLSARKKKP